MADKVQDLFKSELFLNLNKNLKEELYGINSINLNYDARSKVMTGNLKIDSLKLINNFKNKNLNEAKIIAVNIIKKYPKNINALKILGSINQIDGQFFEALKINNKLLQLKHNDFEVLNNLGLIYMNLNNYLQAKKNFMKAIEVDPKNPNVYFNLASLYMKYEQNDLAVASLKDTLSINSLFYDAHYNLGLLAFKKLDYYNAKDFFKKAIDIKPSSAEAYYNLALVQQSLKDFENSKLNYQNSLIHNPNYALSLNNLGIILSQTGEVENSQIIFTKAVDLIPTFQEAIFNLANSYVKMNKLEAAIQHFNFLIGLDVNKYGLLARVNLAIIYFLKSDLINCRNLLNDSLSIKDKNEKFYENKIIYWHYISKLINWRDINLIQSNDLFDKIYVVGDSHALTYQSLNLNFNNKNYILESHWIEGCKMWHLGNNLKNNYKYQFNQILKNIPDYSNVIFSFGEIDCRFDEGVFDYIKKNPQLSITEVQKSTIINYLEFINEFKTSKDLNIFIQGIPCPNTKLIINSALDEQLFIKSVNDFNILLKHYSIQSGYEFINLHALTNRGDGRSHNLLHIDEHHLSPDAIIEYWATSFSN
jgi:tetratricopeptide (TPR) repeat protein